MDKLEQLRGGATIGDRARIGDGGAIAAGDAKAGVPRTNSPTPE